MKLQKKSLQHVSEKLKNFDTNPVYSAVSDALDKINISNTDKTTMLKMLEFETSKLKHVVKDVKDWVDIIISDIDEHTT